MWVHMILEQQEGEEIISFFFLKSISVYKSSTYKKKKGKVNLIQ